MLAVVDHRRGQPVIVGLERAVDELSDDGLTMCGDPLEQRAAGPGMRTSTRRMQTAPPEHDDCTFPGLRDASRPVPQEADVVVVGAGVVGLATARELAVGGARIA
ncbi:MAG: hypothetical protein U0S48_08850 [Solirubrobacteraceae bacterium]